MRKRTLLPQPGFSVVEGFLLVILLAIIIGAGVFIMKKSKTTPENATSSAVTASSVATKTDPAKVGTADGVDQASDQEASQEASITSKYESSEQQSAANTNVAAGNVGGAYNETNL